MSCSIADFIIFLTPTEPLAGDYTGILGSHGQSTVIQYSLSFSFVEGPQV